MKKKSCSLLILLSVFLTSAWAQKSERELAFTNYHRYYKAGQQVKDASKEASIEQFRSRYAKQAYRGATLKLRLSVDQILGLWSDNGSFTDLTAKETQTMGLKNQEKVGLFLAEAFDRIWKVAEAFRSNALSVSTSPAIFKKVQKAIVYYGNLETGRSNKVNKFHASCFAIPTAAVNIYFCFLPAMDEAESGRVTDADLIAACDMLKVLGLQAWTQPLRHDETDQNVVDVSRFRNHVWWVGGNALAYRSLLPVAMMYRSIPMVDVLAEVSQRGIGQTSQTTYQDAFWIEGCTADGAGWGHGMQCLVWGYPIDGNIYALDILTTLKRTPWEQPLSADNVRTLMNFLQGSSWFYYKGQSLPYLDRYTSKYSAKAQKIRSLGLVNKLLKEWSDSFSAQQIEELRCLKKEAESLAITMKGYPDGRYTGSRWFFNNDKLIKKNSRYHLLINMASVRCDGLESATNFADEYNFCPTDGMTLFQKRGNEYQRAVGAWDVTATPGVTAREGMDQLEPVTNWRGYCSKHNFAGGTTSNGENAVAGYLFEKMNASDKKAVNDRGNSGDKNAILYGVKAFKSYFILGDYVVALGAGITNLTPHVKGTIRTTIDQTERVGELSLWCDGKQMSVLEGVHSLVSGKKPLWVMQTGGFAYSVLPEYSRQAYFTTETKPTEWVKRNASNKGSKELPTHVDLLRLWVDHTDRPINDTYGYVVYAGEGYPAKTLPFKVLRNDTVVQAVQRVDKTVLEAVFYQADTTLQVEDTELTVSSPCVVLIEKQGRKTKLSLTDATMNKALKTITVRYQGKSHVVALPQGEWCGKAVSMEW